MSWPGFSFPFGAWFFLSLIPLVILYFLKLKRPRVEVPSLALWQSVVNDQRVNSPFQKFRRNLLLLLQLILLCLIVLALMQPFLSAGPETAEHVPVLIDCSASMSSRTADSDQTRLDLAKEQARAMIENLRGQGKIALFEFSTTGKRLTEFTDDQQMLLKALDQIQPTHRPSQLDEVLRMADAFTRTSPVDRVVVITDGNLREQVDFELPFRLDVQRVDTGGDNLGITEMNARRSGRDRWDVFVRVAGSTTEPSYGELTLTKNGLPIGRETISATSENSERVVFSVDGTDAALLQATLAPTGFDALSVDNSVWLTLPKTRPLRIRTSPELYSWQHAFTVQGDVDLDSAASPSLPEYDLIISDSTDLQDIDAPIIVYVGLVPEELKDLISVDDSGSEPVEIVEWVNTAPLLQHVRLRDVQIAQQPRLAEGANTKNLEERGFEVLIHGGAGPLMLQRRLGLETEFWFLFHTDRSTLPYRVAFPILVSNVLEAAMQRASLSEVAAAPTGVLPPLNLQADREYTITGPGGHRRTASSNANGTLLGITADEVGRYDVTDGDELVTSIGTGLLSPLETSLRSVDELQFSELKVTTEETEMIEADLHLWWSLALLAFVFLLIEWWYFQRMKTRLVA